jgi:hypothetical protein
MNCNLCEKYINNELIVYTFYGYYEYVLANINRNISENNLSILDNVYCNYCNLEDTLLTTCLIVSSKREYNEVLNIIIIRIIDCKNNYTSYELKQLKKYNTYFTYFFNKKIITLQNTIFNTTTINLPEQIIYNIIEYNAL